MKINDIEFNYKYQSDFNIKKHLVLNRDIFGYDHVFSFCYFENNSVLELNCYHYGFDDNMCVNHFVQDKQNINHFYTINSAPCLHIYVDNEVVEKLDKLRKYSDLRFLT